MFTEITRDIHTSSHTCGICYRWIILSLCIIVCSCLRGYCVVTGITDAEMRDLSFEDDAVQGALSVMACMWVTFIRVRVGSVIGTWYCSCALSITRVCVCDIPCTNSNWQVIDCIYCNLTTVSGNTCFCVTQFELYMTHNPVNWKLPM